MTQWIKVGTVEDFPPSGGACVLLSGKQIAIFNFTQDEWYAVENKCPHEGQQTLSRGIIGDFCGEPKVACPLHKNSFSLKDGRHLGGNPDWKLKIYPVMVKSGEVLLEMEG